MLAPLVCHFFRMYARLRGCNRIFGQVAQVDFRREGVHRIGCY